MHVVVLGAGISGLACAERLLDAGHRVTLVGADPPQRTTSHLAAAVWFPTAAGPPGRVHAWSEATFAEWTRAAAAGTPGVVVRESLALYRDGLPDPLPAWTDAVGGTRPAAADELPPDYGHGLRFAVPLVEMPRYLPHLHARVLAAGARPVVRRAAGLDELLDLAPDVVVNAAGMAAGALVGDTSTFPVRGQIVRVANPGLTLSVRDEAHPGGRAYVHPRAEDCVLGGTLDVGEWDTTPDPAVTAAILERCSDLAPALAGAEVLEEVVGLRPGRPTVRVERDDDLLPVPVVHDYGHGGSGITIAWGCADEVVALVG